MRVFSFPNRCCDCGQSDPDDQFPLEGAFEGFSYSVQVPICRDCHDRHVRRRRRLNQVAFGAGAGIGLLAAAASFVTFGVTAARSADERTVHAILAIMSAIVLGVVGGMVVHGAGCWFVPEPVRYRWRFGFPRPRMPRIVFRNRSVHDEFTSMNPA